jgi:hypothetical protein
MNDTCIVVFTSRSAEQMLSEGGSQSWVLDPKRARRCAYVVCAWNSSGEFAGLRAGRQHGEAYLVAPITSIEPVQAHERSPRFCIRFKEVALINIPNAWGGQRNPVFYTTLKDLGINVEDLTFEAVASVMPGEATISPHASLNGAVAPLTIAAAKRGLAVCYGVEPEAIEIVIRG